MKYRLLTGLLFAAALAAQPKPGNGTIDGHVSNLLTGEPLRKATVTLRGRDGTVLNDDTNAEGRFHFAGLPAGTYRISAMRDRFVDHSARYAITLGPNDNVAGAEVKLAPQGVISGRVLDEDNDPMPRAAVSLFKLVYRNGKREWERSSGGIANDAGEYRFPVVPGRYAVSATSQRRIVDNTYGDPPKMFYVPVYYPNATTRQAAVPIEVGLGGDVRGIDIPLIKRPAQRSFQVKGKLTSVPAGSNEAIVAAFGSVSGGDGVTECGGGTMASAPDYSFELSTHGGQCTISANSYSGSPDAYGSVNMAINADVTGLVIPLTAAPRPAGQFRFADGTAQVPLDRIGISLSDLSPGDMHQTFTIRVDATGKFELGKPVRPGHYAMSVNGVLPDGYFVREARMSQQEISLDDVDIQSSTPIDVILSNTAAKIKGSVVDGDGKPFPISTVTLIPADGKSRAVKQAADDNGNFELAHLRPGKYVLFAWEEIDNDLWPDPDFRKKYEGRATEVTVGPSESGNAQVRVILAEEMK